jgi:hypothetical protein
MSDETKKAAPTPEEAANLVDRYQRGQGIEFIRFATGFGRKHVLEALAARGLKPRGKGRRSVNPNWGWTGGAP